MFFNNNNKLEEKIEEKDEQINTLQLAIKELNAESEHKLKLKAEEIGKLNRKLKLKTEEFEELEKKLEHKTRELEASVDNLERVTNTDTLTGAYNKRYFYDVAESIISLAKREKHSLSLAMLELNEFEEINKTLGYKTGDEVLQTFVHKITLRESDVFVRFSDTEFVILLPNTDIKQAVTVSQKIRKDIDSYDFFKSIKLTVSLGVTEYVLAEDNIYNALQRVKGALEKAENNSVNSVV
ncbi:MAG: GGDEF domain-containing protein [Campylobacterota bacterium]|nr:GGDEF domain-containing protein [Campylobacterota bacterium]